MPQLRSIEIDFDIHKLIEAERKSFDEPPYVALRRLLGLPPSPTEMALATLDVPPSPPFREDGVEVPHGSRARMEYDRGKQLFEGRFLNGKLVVDGRTFDSLSGAASELAITRKGTRTKLNGWLYWSVQLPGQTEWMPMKDVRRQARLRSAAAAGRLSSS
jgi:hypothetical protein